MNTNMIQSSPISGAPSPVSDDSSVQPHSPASSGDNIQIHSKTLGGKRKGTRRASTAERRATHNAVERARRETLNGRFLDLAALLPNLSQLRRPSKSAIVNSSIAHIHAARRHRLLASRELRLLKLESDALRRELNEWRNRAGIPRIDEPVRGDGFSVVLSGEPEIIPIPGGPGYQDDGDEDGYGEEMEDDYRPVADKPMHSDEEARAAAIMNSQPQGSFVPAINTNVHSMMRPTSMPSRAHPINSPAGGPMIASPTNMPYENPMMGRVYETVPYNTGDAYSGPYGPAQVGGFGYGNANDQAYLKSLAQHRRSRSSSHSSGSASPLGYYEQPGWNGTGMRNGGNVNMNVNMHNGDMGNMGMVGGGGSTMGNGGVTFAMM